MALQQVHPANGKIMRTYTTGSARGQITYYGNNYYIMGNTGEEDNGVELWKLINGTFVFQRLIVLTGAAQRGLATDGKYIYLLLVSTNSNIYKYSITGELIDTWNSVSRGDLLRGLTFDAAVGVQDNFDFSAGGKFLYTLLYSPRTLPAGFDLWQLDFENQKIIRQTKLSLVSNFEAPVELTFDGKDFWVISDYSLAALLRSISKNGKNLRQFTLFSMNDGVTFNGKYLMVLQQ